jgi:hypothetical protein
VGPIINNLQAPFDPILPLHPATKNFGCPAHQLFHPDRRDNFVLTRTISGRALKLAYIARKRLDCKPFLVTDCFLTDGLPHHGPALFQARRMNRQ